MTLHLDSWCNHYYLHIGEERYLVNLFATLFLLKVENDVVTLPHRLKCCNYSYKLKNILMKFISVLQVGTSCLRSQTEKRKKNCTVVMGKACKSGFLFTGNWTETYCKWAKKLWLHLRSVTVDKQLSAEEAGLTSFCLPYFSPFESENK